ncbi:AAA family ATPase [Desulforegula conservatrix]|uniref:AAA family ATPase n=1 Tax=Desulforegula conservatrix TaxID=153026 RepID=UPI000427B499|nr:AAA family ATPase [Desulforegula conservatrix]
MISKIWYNELQKDYTTNEKSPDGIPFINIGRLNLFIGANNSGKSRLLRILFGRNENEVSTANAVFSEKVLKGIGPLLKMLPKDKFITGLKGEELHAIVDCNIKKTNERNQAYGNYLDIIEQRSTFSNSVFKLATDEVDKFQFLNKVNNLSSKGIDIGLNIEKSIGGNISPFSLPARYYIPILRGMRPLHDSKNKFIEAVDIFKNRTIKDYFSDNGNSISHSENNIIITGYLLYKLLAEHLLGEPEQRRLIKEYEKLIGQEFFGGEEVTLIPEIKRDTVAVKIGNEKQFPIYDLGDGLQQIIIITSAAFLHPDPSMFFIEEPENCLHPGFLRKLALFLLEHTEHQYFIATHSNHLLDLGDDRDDVFIHRLSKTVDESGSKFSIKECSKDREILTDLGVKASSVYLANCTIWVEGITDRLYLRCFMNKYIESLDQENSETKTLQGYLENYHYAFIEYQGGNLVHWDFADDDVDGGADRGLCALRACSEAFLIADGDIKNKGDRVKKLTEEMGDRFCLLKGKETENLLPEIILKTTATDIFNKMTRDRIGLDINDIESLTEGIYQKSNQGIGFHLDKTLGLEGEGVRRIFADESGTINGKVGFCKKAIKVMEDVEWELTEPLKDLCGKIFAHIKRCNQ